MWHAAAASGRPRAGQDQIPTTFQGNNVKSIFEACASSAPACRARASVRKSALLRLLPAGLLALAALPAAAQVSLNALGTPATQNFDTLPTTGSITWTDNSTLAGWYLARTGTPVAPFAVAASNGSSTAGSFFSYGTGTAADRALGSQGSNATSDQFYGVRLKNNTGSTITSLDVSYVGEQWRNGGNTSTQSLTFSYVVGPSPLTDLTSAGTAVPSLDFASPVTGATAAALDGNAIANRTPISATISGLNIPSGSEVMLRWKDINDPGNDHGLAIDDFSVTPHGSAPAAPALSINDVTQAAGTSATTFTFTISLAAPSATPVSVDAATADGTATAPADYASVPTTTLTIPAGQTSTTLDVSVNGTTATGPSKTFFVNLSNASTGATITDAQGVGTIQYPAPPTITRIHDVQGPGAATPIPNATVTVEAIVTGNFLGAGKLNGFFLQEEDVNTDADPATSEGIFIYCASCNANAVAEGQRVRVTGVVSEFQGVTQITAATAGAVVVADGGNHMAAVTPATVSLPIPAAVDVNAYYEARESMLVKYDTSLTVTEYFQLARFGQIQLVAGDRPRQFTEDAAPDVAGYAAHLDALARRSVILDDDNNMQNVTTTQPSGQQAVYYPHTNGGFSKGTQGLDYFRGGDKVQSLTGILHWSWPGFGANTWRIRPSDSYPVSFTVGNPRPTTTPVVGGSIRAVGMNLLNYFTTLTTSSSTTSGPCGPSGTLPCRGANSAAELARQTERASLVVCSLNPDVAGFMELENSTPHTTTINYLLDAINARCGGTHPYKFVDTGGTLGSDAIRVMLVYRQGIVAPFGSPKVDLDPIHSRPPTAQTFDVVDAGNPALGKRFTVVANHFKSKGSCPTGSGADADNNDGQGCWAGKRTQQASRLLTWLNGTVIPAAQSADVLLLGDFNAYASEPPVTTLKSGGYADLETDFHGTNAYSYLFSGELGHLDYAFASSSLRAQVTGADAWHINADESDLFDYNDEIRDAGEAAYDAKPNGSSLTPPRSVWEPNTPYRASDHDPVVVGLFGTTDMEVSSLTATPDPVIAGDQLTYTFNVVNNGPAAALDAKWSDALPAGTTFVSVSGDPSWSCTAPAIGATGLVQCSKATFTAGTTAPFTLKVTVGASVPGGTTLANTVSASTSTGDTVPSNNSASVSTTVNAAPQGQLTISPTTLAFGNQVVGTTSASQSVTLINTGNAALDVTVVAAASPFTRTGAGSCGSTSPITIAAGVSCTLAYTFTPAAVGAATQTLSVTANGPGSGSIVLSGNGTQGHLTISPTTLSFGDQAIGTTSSVRTATLKNDGTAPLNVTAVTAASTPFAAATGTSCNPLGQTLAVNASCTLAYVFTPTTAGPASQMLTVTADAPGGGTITLSGYGLQGALDISPASVDFGNQSVGTTSATRTIAIKNGGDAPLSVTALTAASTPFARTGGDCPAVPITLAPGNYCTLAYTFTPTTTGAASQTLTVTANGPGGNTIALSGTGTLPQVADVAVTLSSNRHFAQVGDTLNYVITVTNASGPATAAVLVHDMLPGGLVDGSWTCTPAGTATCAGGTGDVLGDTATLPSGTQVSYVYSATVQAGAPDTIVNHVSADVSNVSDPNPANNSADDTTTIVIFRNGFELEGSTLALAPHGDGHGFVSALLTIDRSLLGSVGIMPVAIASGRMDDGRTAFTLELARFGASHYLRLTSIEANGRSLRGEWQAAELGQPLDFAWQSATAGRNDGYLRIAAGTTELQSVDRTDSARLIQIRTPVAADATPWLSVGPE